MQFAAATPPLGDTFRSAMALVRDYPDMAESRKTEARRRLSGLLAEAGGNIDALLQYVAPLNALAIAAAGQDLTLPDPELRKVEKTAAGMLANPVLDPTLAANLAFLCLGLNTLMHGPARGMEKFMVMAVGGKDGTPGRIDQTMALSLFGMYGWKDAAQTEWFETVFNSADPLATDNEGKASGNFLFSYFIMAPDTADDEKTALITEKFLIPSLLAACKKDFFAIALYIENTLYKSCLKKKETEEHYDSQLRRWTPAMEKAGARFASKVAWPRAEASGKPVVAIFMHTVTELAHVEILRASFAGFSPQDDLPFKIRIYCLNADEAYMKRVFTPLGIDYVILGYDPANLLLAFVRMKNKMAADNVKVCIWICLTTFMGFAYGMKVAPTQIYWSMKMHPSCLTLPDDLWAGCPTEKTRDFFGKTWTALPIAYTPPQAPPAADVETLRKAYGEWKTVFGVVAREEMVCSRPYLETVAALLKKNHDAVFVYTGQKNLQEIIDVFSEAGVEGQTRFIGWTPNPALTISTFDVYLDPWPHRSGTMAYYAYKLGVPRVFCVDGFDAEPNVRYRVLGYDIEPGSDGYTFVRPEIDAIFDSGKGRTLTACADANDYMDKVSSLLADKEYYDACVRSAKTYAKLREDNTQVKERFVELISGYLQKTAA